MIGMYSMMGGMGNVSGAMNSQNVPQYFEQRYSFGYSGMNPNGRPYFAGYPRPTIPPAKHLPPEDGIIHFLKNKIKELFFLK